MSWPVRRIAVVGLGAIGSSWTALFLASGFDVVAADSGRAAEAKLRRYVDSVWGALEVIGVSPQGSPEHLSFTTDVAAAAASADFVQECVADEFAVKTDMLAQLGRAASATTIIASSTAFLSITLLQARCAHPERYLVGHSLNPPHLLPLVEVVGGAKTCPKVIEAAMALYALTGRKPIHVRKEVAGHVANRLQAALFREAVSLLAQGVVSVGEIDTAVCWGVGPRWGAMGPHLLFHIGCESKGIHGVLEHFSSTLGKVWAELGEPEFSPELRQTIIDGVLAELGDRSVSQLVRERDEILLGLLKLRTRDPKSPPRAARRAGRGAAVSSPRKTKPRR